MKPIKIIDSRFARTTTHEVLTGGCLSVMHREWESPGPDKFPRDPVDLVVTSPPYSAKPKYTEGGETIFDLKGMDYVDWLADRVCMMTRICRGLVCVVIQGGVGKFRYDSTPFLLVAYLYKYNIHLWQSPFIYHRHGNPGSGGPQGWKCNYEFVLPFVAGHIRRLPWAMPLADAKPPKYAPGGPCSNRDAKGVRAKRKAYKPPALANPGNVISGPVGKGHMGSDLAHKGEAPFPEWLVSPIIRAYCPPGGVVVDPFAGSGTVAAVAMLNGRSSVSIDLRSSQAELTESRIRESLFRSADTGEQCRDGETSSNPE